MRYFFILGRNVKLSTAEIFSYFEKEKISVLSWELKLNGLIVETNENLDTKKIINSLGGAIGAGKILFSGSMEDIIKGIRDKEIFFEDKAKFLYSILDYSDSQEIADSGILEEIKKRFRQEKVKAIFKRITGEIELQEGGKVAGSPSKMKSVDAIYFLFKDNYYSFGLIDGLVDYSEIEKRDMKKPVRRSSLSISPRLAKILINLSQVRENEVLLDPFCGVGTVLQEALLEGIYTIGIDIEKKAIFNSKRNLLWLNKNYKVRNKFKLINKDAGKIKLDRIDGIATEPPLGRLLKSLPSEESGADIIKRFEGLLLFVLTNIRKDLKRGGKIAFTAPLIKTTKGKVFCNIERIQESTGLRVSKLKNIKFPIEEYRQDSVVGREFWVLEKIY